MSLGSPDRRASRSAKRHFSSGNRTSLLPFDNALPPTVDPPQRTPPKTARIETTHKIMKSQDKPSISNGTSLRSPPKPSLTPSSSYVPNKTLKKWDPPSQPPSSKKRSASSPTIERPFDPSFEDDFSVGFADRSMEFDTTPQKPERTRAALPMPILAPLPPPEPTHVVPLASSVSVMPTSTPLPSVSRTPVVYSTEPFFAEKEPSSPRPRVLFAVTGSVAAIKLNELLRLLNAFAEVIVVTTKSAEHFVADYGSSDVDGVRFYNDASEYTMWHARNDPVLHIELRKWADIFLIAPLSANSLAKLANGLCDNLVTSIARAWDFERPFYVAPAMNTLMWTHPFTQKHLGILTDELGISVIPPVQKTLMCGDKGTQHITVHQIFHVDCSLTKDHPSDLYV